MWNFCCRSRTCFLQTIILLFCKQGVTVEIMAIPLKFPFPYSVHQVSWSALSTTSGKNARFHNLWRRAMHLVKCTFDNCGIKRAIVHKAPQTAFWKKTEYVIAQQGQSRYERIKKKYFWCFCKGAIIESGRTACITARPINIIFTLLSFATNNYLSRIRNFTGT